MNYTLNPRRKSCTLDFWQKRAMVFLQQAAKKSVLSKVVTGGSSKIIKPAVRVQVPQGWNLLVKGKTLS